jgi:Flp pilus assembly pilin Flp
MRAQGQDMVEYALMLALVAIVVVVVLLVLGAQLVNISNVVAALGYSG